MRISDWSSDVCSSDLRHAGAGHKCAANGLRWRRHATMLARHQHKEVVMIRTVLGVVLGAIAAILALAGAGHAALALHPLPAGGAVRTLADAAGWLEDRKSVGEGKCV